MRNLNLLGPSIAMLTGILVGIQITINARIGSFINPVKAGVYLNIASGVAGLVVLAIWGLVLSGKFEPVQPALVGWLMIAGFLSVAILSGIAYSMNVAGVASGMSAIIFGQLLVSVIVDAKGWGATEPIPLTAARVIGLLAIMGGVYLLLPKSA